jgi:hypothetical protein
MSAIIGPVAEIFWSDRLLFAPEFGGVVDFKAPTTNSNWGSGHETESIPLPEYCPFRAQFQSFPKTVVWFLGNYPAPLPLLSLNARGGRSFTTMLVHLETKQRSASPRWEWAQERNLIVAAEHQNDPNPNVLLVPSPLGIVATGPISTCCQMTKHKRPVIKKTLSDQRRQETSWAERRIRLSVKQV